MKAKYPKETSWKIVYSDFSGMERTAAEFLNREAGRLLIRQEGVYTLHVLPLERETADTTIPQNAIVLGTWDESAIIRAHVPACEIPENGYVLKIADNPADPDGSLVLITAHDQRSLLYGAAAFIDRYAPMAAPDVGGLHFTNRLFDHKLPCCTISSAPRAKTRGIFCWGHSTNDYRTYIASMARLGLNQLIVWNDHKPVNADEITAYAHKFGIELIWGFAWGWIAGCSRIQSIDEAYLAELKAQVLRKFENEYAGQGDGIYFQSFTERQDDSIGGRPIADTVTDFVNDTAGELLRRYPSLRIQFGLHATSVKNRLDAIARVDKRVEIVWEDGGVFPFDPGAARIENPDAFEEKFQETLAFTEKILRLRGTDAPTGIVFKGFMKLDWERFVYQAGPYIMGENAPEICEHDRRLRSDAWRAFTADWLQNGDYARRFAERIYEITKGNVNLCMAATFDGGVYFPQAACAEIFWDPTRTYGEIMKAAADKPMVTLN